MVRTFVLSILGTFALFGAFASASTPDGLTFQGRIIRPDGSPLEAVSVAMNVRVLSPTNNCILLEENHTVPMAGTAGVFSLIIGGGTRAGADKGFSLLQVFKNSGTLTGLSCGTVGVTQYPAASGEPRRVRVTFTDGTETVTLNSDFIVRTIPYALIADTVQGKLPTDFVQINTTGTKVLSQTNLEQVFDGAAFTELSALIAGTSTQYAKSTTLPVSGGSLDMSSAGKDIIVRDTPTSGDSAVNKDYVDSVISGAVAGSHDHDAADIVSGTFAAGRIPTGTDDTKLPLAGGTMTGDLDMGGKNILATGHITMSPEMTINLGTYDDAAEDLLDNGLGLADKGKFWYNTDSNQIKFWNGTAVAVLGSSSSGIQSLNGATGNSQTIQLGTTGTSPNIATAGDVHTIHIPEASNSAKGVMSTGAGLTAASGVVTPDFGSGLGKVVQGNDDRLNPAPVIGDALSFIRMNAGGTAYEVRTPTQVKADLGLGTMSTATAADYFKADGSTSMGGNIKLNGKYLSNDGDNEGISVDNDGKVKISKSLEVSGTDGEMYLQGDNSSAFYIVSGSNANRAKVAVINSGVSDLNTNDPLGEYRFQGEGGGGWQVGASISSYATGNFSGTSSPANIVFSTTPSGSTSVVDRMYIGSDGKVGIGTTGPHASSILDISSTAAGLLIPRMTETQRDGILTPATGLQVYNTTSNKINFYNGTAWTELSTGSGSVADTRTITAGTGLTGGGNLTADRTLAVDFGTGAGKVVQGNDVRLAPAPTGLGGQFVRVNAGATAYETVALGTIATATATDYLDKAGNLSGLANAGTARTNLGLGTAATAASTDFIAAVTPGTSGNVLTSNGTAWTSSALPVATATVNGIMNTGAGLIVSSGEVTPDFGTGIGKVVQGNDDRLAPAPILADAGKVVRVNAGGTAYETFTLSGSGDFMKDGSITMTGNIKLGGKYLSNDGDDEGLAVDNSGKVGIGTTSPGQKLSVVGTIESTSGGFKFPDGSTQSTAAGTGKWTSTTNGIYSNNGVVVGFGAGASNVNLFLTTAWSGNDPGSSNSGMYNLGVGAGALTLNTTGSDNTVVGALAGVYNTTGNGNTAVGKNALAGKNAGTNTGSYNTAIGHYALLGNLTGSAGSYNIALGSSAGSALTTGSYNVIIGSDTGSSIAALSNYILLADGQGNRRMTIDNSGNVGIGTTSPSANFNVVTTGTGAERGIMNTQISSDIKPGVFIGQKARGAVGSLSAVADGDLITTLLPYAYDGSAFQQTGYAGFAVKGTVSGGSVPTDFVINTGTGGLGSERMRISSDGKVGIGTAPSSSATLKIKGSFEFESDGTNTPEFTTNATGTDDATGRFNIDTGTGGSYIAMYGANYPGRTGNFEFTSGYGGEHLFVNQSNGWTWNTHMIIKSDGKVGIGTETPSEKLHVSGNVLATAFLYSSDRRLKENISPINNALESLMHIPGVTYNWRKTPFKDDPRPQMGLIAQEVEEEFPQAVIMGADGYRRVDYPMLVAPIIQAIRELYTKFIDQSNEVEALKARIRDQDKRMERLEKIVCEKDPSACKD